MVEVEDEDGVRLGVVLDALTVARDLGASDDVVLLGKVRADGRITWVRVEDGGDGMAVSDKLDKIHRALSHDGDAQTCPAASCRRVRSELDTGVEVGREDKMHPAGWQAQK